MAFGDFLAVSPSQVLADEAEKRRLDLAAQQEAEQARQFQIKTQELAQERAAARESALASGQWEQQKFGLTQGLAEKKFGADQAWQAGTPGRDMALEAFKAGLKPDPVAQAIAIAQGTQPVKTQGAIDIATAESGLKPKDNYVDIGGGLQQNTVDGKISSTGAHEPPAPGVTWKIDEKNPAYQVSSLGKRELIPIPDETPEAKRQAEAKIRADEEAAKNQQNELALQRVQAQGLTVPEAATVGGVRYGKPAEDKATSTFATYTEAQQYILDNGLPAGVNGYLPRQLASGKWIITPSSLLNQTGQQQPTGGNSPLPANPAPAVKDKYTTGQTVKKNGVTYKYIGNNQWQKI